jgi:hypothetical protein
VTVALTVRWGFTLESYCFFVRLILLRGWWYNPAVLVFRGYEDFRMKPETERSA